jgi:hypothetical protein
MVMKEWADKAGRERLLTRERKRKYGVEDEKGDQIGGADGKREGGEISITYLIR